jgi:hypothetical protein
MTVDFPRYKDLTEKFDLGLWRDEEGNHYSPRKSHAQRQRSKETSKREADTQPEAAKVREAAKDETVGLFQACSHR